MIHRISVTVTKQGLQLNTTNSTGGVIQQIWVPAQVDITPTIRPQAVASWCLGDPLERLAPSLLPLAENLTQSFGQSALPCMQALTFDIGPGWVDCHVMMTSFEEVVLRYPLRVEVASGALVLPVLPVVQAGRLDALPDAFLTAFHQAVKTRFWLLAQQLMQQQARQQIQHRAQQLKGARSASEASTEDAA